MQSISRLVYSTLKRIRDDSKTDLLGIVTAGRGEAIFDNSLHWTVRSLQPRIFAKALV